MRRARLGKRIVRSSLFAGLVNRATQYAKNPEKLKDLTSKARRKAESAGSGGPLHELWEALMTFLRFILAYARGDYRQVSWQPLVLIVAAVLYFLMPIDVIPDFIVGLGYVDDAAVIAWVMSTVGSEVEKFRQWEASRATQAASH